jgi:protein-disulfide isomerase
MSQLKASITRQDHLIGPLDAPVTLVEYGDYECPHCAMAHPVVASLLKHFDDQLLFAFRHFPLTEVHPNAQAAAQSAEFCGAHGLFWEMHNSLFANQADLGLPLLFALVRELGLSDAQLGEALEQETYAPKVRNDFLSGVRSGVNGTPCFFINGQRHNGSYAFDELYAAIEASGSHRAAV